MQKSMTPKYLLKHFPNDCVGTKNAHKPCHYNKKGVCDVHQKRKDMKIK